MRKILLTLAALAAFGLALPVMSGTADARVVVIKKGHGHGWHGGYNRGRHVGWNRGHRGNHQRGGARVIIR